jgi:hypothetical protein
MKAQVNRVDVAIRRTTTAIVSYRHMHTLTLGHGETMWTAALIPLSVDGMIVASSMSLLLDSRRGTRSGLLPWALLLIGSTASLGANVAVAEPTIYGRLIAAWPSLALIGAYELLMRQIRLSTAGARTADAEVRALPNVPRTEGASTGHRKSGPTGGSTSHLRRANTGAVANRDLFQQARRLDADHWAAHRRPVSAETLRRELGIGMVRARQLRDEVRSAQLTSRSTASHRQSAAGSTPPAPLAASAQ